MPEDVCMDRQENGAIITAAPLESVICLGKFECEILDVILGNSIDQALHILLNTYQGDTIENDVIEFCEKMCEHGILQKQKI